MAMQDRLDDVLQARSLPDDLIAPGHLPAKRLRRLVRNPDFGQKAARIKLGEDAGVDRIGLDLRMGDDAHLLGVCDHDFLDVRRDHCCDRRRVSGRFDDDHILLRKLLCESLEKRPAHVNAPQSFELPSSQATASAKARWMSRPMIRMVAAPSLFVQGGSWRATRHLLIRAHDASGKVARGGHVTSSASRPTVYRRPARTFVLPAPRVQDRLTISPSPFRKQADSAAPTDHIPDNGQVERMNRTIKDATVKRDFYETLDQDRGREPAYRRHGARRRRAHDRLASPSSMSPSNSSSCSISRSSFSDDRPKRARRKIDSRILSFSISSVLA